MQAQLLRLRGQLSPRRAVSRRFLAAATASSFDPPPPPKTFANFSIYKGKSAMQVAPLAPTFEQLGTAQTTARDGGLLLTFAPASGPKAYDWAQKQLFSVGVTELGELLAAFGHGAATRSLEFYHDPGKGGPSEGQTAKKLQVSPLGKDDVMFNLSVSTKGQEASRLSVPVTSAELEVLCSIARFVIPRALGFDKVMM